MKDEQSWEKMTPVERQYWGMVHPFDFQRFSYGLSMKKKGGKKGCGK